jgi:integrase
MLCGDMVPRAAAEALAFAYLVEAGERRKLLRLVQRRRRQREAGLGSVARVPLAAARSKATEWRSLLAKGIDPLGAKEAAQHVPTFEIVAAQLIDSKRSGWRSSVHAGQWGQTLATYCKAIADRRINELNTEDVLRVLTPIWQRIPETASRLRGRLEMIFDSAKARGWRTGENPAAMKGNLAHVLPRRQKIAQAHFAAMAYRDVPDFVASLKAKPTTLSSALEFLILTAARSGEVLGARWSEINFDTAVWTIPAARMKGGALHRVPLSQRAIEILREIGSHEGLIFSEKGQAMHPRKLRALVRPATVHGFRSAFRDWAGEETSFSREIAEQALAHATGNEVERAYRRGDALERRRELMSAWASYCCAPDLRRNVVPIRGTL